MTTQDSQSELDKLVSDIELLANTAFYDLETTEEAKRLIEAYVTTRVKEAERLARIEESKLWYNDWGNGSEEQTIGDGSWEDYYDYRIEALTTTTNGKKV